MFEGLTMYAENGVGKCGFYDCYGNRISYSNIPTISEYRIIALAYFTGIRLAGFNLALVPLTL